MNHVDGSPDRMTPFIFNPYEIAFCGQAGSSRSTLVSRLVRMAFTDHIVAHVDHDVPHQTHHNEQTFVYCESTRFQHVLVYPARKEEHVRPWPFLDADMVFIEEGHDCKAPQIVVLDELQKSRFSNVIAYVGRRPSCAGQATGAPSFHRDDLKALQEFILDYFLNRTLTTMPLYGLVLAGGKSSRMNSDKSALHYHGKPQVRHCYDLLATHCDKVFVSMRHVQAGDPVHTGLPQIHDRFQDFGPIGGILSALKEHPNAAWLVLAVDLPFMDAPTLERLVKRRNPFKLATAYVGGQGKLPEPLCAIYEPKSVFRLMHFLAMGQPCPRKVLMHSDTNLVEPANPLALTNVNDPEEYHKAVNLLRGRRRAIM